MDHDTAVRTRAAERYALGEMAADEATLYEAHYFECSACAEEVKAATHFIANARVWFQQQPAESARIPEPGRWRMGWGPAWLSPALAAVFAVIAGYSWLVTVPQLRRQAAIGVYQPLMLRAETRGGTLPEVQATPGSRIALTLEIETEREYAGYDVEVLDPAGRGIARESVPAGLTVSVVLPGDRLRGGVHTIVVRGGTHDHPEIGRYRFGVRVGP